MQASLRMQGNSAIKCWRVPAAAQIFVRSRPLAATPLTYNTTRRWNYTSAISSTFSTHHASNTPPPLTATPLRRHTAVQRRSSPTRSASHVGNTATSSTAATHPVATLHWTDVLTRHSNGSGSSADLATPPPSRVVLREAAALCLAEESPKTYAVYRPCHASDADASHPSAAPHDFVTLLAYMRTTPCLSSEARHVAEVLIDLLRKPPHPRYPGPWDISLHESRALKAKAIALVLEGSPTGDDALAWLVRLLGLSDTFAEANADAASAAVHLDPATLLRVAMTERVDQRDAAAPRRVSVDDPDGDWLLSSSSVVVGAVAGAMLRSAAGGVRGAALELLETAALARLTRGTATGGAAATPAVAGDAPNDAALLFNEAVAVHCAEVAAMRGDVETVTRLIFLLYRVRGALGFATLAEHRRQRRTSRGSSDGGQRWTVSGLLPRTPAWMRASWWGGDGGPSALHTAPSASAADGDDTDVRFEHAVVRLLKSVMHAALYHPSRNTSGGSGDVMESSMEEALSLWDGLRGGTSWSGLAAMATELLEFLVRQHAHLATTGAAANAQRLQQAGLRVYTQLARAVLPRHRSSAQQEVVHHCVTLMMQLFSTSSSIRVERDGAADASGQRRSSVVVVPSVLTSDAAEHTLRLFADVKDTTQQEALLPFALAASLTLLSTAAAQKTYQPPARLFGSLARYFATVQSLHYYCAASATTPSAPAHVVASGSLVLLHVFLLSHTSLGPWAREDGELSVFLQRFYSSGSASDAQRTQLHAWLCISGGPQRQLLWSLLLSLKRRDTWAWCGATIDLFATPAASAAAFTAAAVLYNVLPPAELRATMALLYECGNTADPVSACATLDRVVTAAAQMPLHTLTLAALAVQLQSVSAAGGRSAVLVLTDATLCALVLQRVQTTTTSEKRATVNSLADSLHQVYPLLFETSVHPAPSFVYVILTPACLMELQHLREQAGDTAQHGIVEALHAALTGSATPSTYRVAVAGAWPVLPSLATALRQHVELRPVADGLREVAAAARHVEQTFAKESRPVVCLWAGEETTPATTSCLASLRLGVLEHYGAREVSTHRAHVVKAKSDIFSLLRRSPLTGDADFSDLRVAADVAAAAAAESNAARRVRNKSLLSAVSPKRRGQRTL